MTEILPRRVPTTPPCRKNRKQLPTLAVDATGLGVMLNLSRRTICSLNSAGKLPHYILSDGSLRLRWDEVEPLVRRMPGSLTSIEGVNRG